MSGDILEEYRESIVPALGSKANGWYVRQVAGYLLRSAWGWGVLIGAILVIRYLLDFLAPVQYTAGITHPRSAVTSYALMAAFATGAAVASWRSRHIRSGMLVAVTMAVFGGVLSSAWTLLCLAIWHDAGTLRAIQDSGGLSEGLWVVPLLLVPLGVFTGGLGAIVGRLAEALVSSMSRRGVS